MLRTILLIIAAILFGLAAFHVNGPIDFVAAGLCLVAVALIV